MLVCWCSLSHQEQHDEQPTQMVLAIRPVADIGLGCVPAAHRTGGDRGTIGRAAQHSGRTKSGLAEAATAHLGEILGQLVPAVLIRARRHPKLAARPGI